MWEYFPCSCHIFHVVAWTQLSASMTIFLREFEIFKQIGDILHIFHMEEASCLEKALLWMKIWHSVGACWNLENVWYIWCLHRGMELTWARLSCNNVHARGVDPMDYMGVLLGFMDRSLVHSHNREREIIYYIHKPCFLGWNAINTSSNHNMWTWMVCGSLTIIKDWK